MPWRPEEAIPEVKVPSAPAASPAPEASDGAGETRSPWEQASPGTRLAAFIETVKGVLFKPRAFFEGMTTRDSRGSFSFAFACIFIGDLSALLWGMLQLEMQKGQFAELEKLGSDPKMVQLLQKLTALTESFYQGPAFLLLPVTATLWIFLMAGLYHLVAMVIGANQHGFSATFRAYCYSQAPQLFLLLPGCGGLVAWIWSLALTGYGLMVLQRVSAAKAVAIVLVPVGMLILLVGMVAIMAVAVVAKSAGAAAP